MNESAVNDWLRIVCDSLGVHSPHPDRLEDVRAALRVMAHDCEWASSIVRRLATVEMHEIAGLITEARAWGEVNR